MAKRKTISQKTRFEVFKRDAFTCQYCGRKSPEVILNVDHIVPVASGGMNDIVNLLTSCQGCNSGKGKRHIATREVIEKSYDAVREIAERAEQLKMMADWQKQVYDAESAAIEMVSLKWKELSGHDPNSIEQGVFRRLIRKHSLPDVINGVEYSFARNLEPSDFGSTTRHKREVVLRWLPTSVSYEAKPQSYKDARWLLACIQNHFEIEIRGLSAEILEPMLHGTDKYSLRDKVFACNDVHEAIAYIKASLQ